MTSTGRLVATALVGQGLLGMLFPAVAAIVGVAVATPPNFNPPFFALLVLSIAVGGLIVGLLIGLLSAGIEAIGRRIGLRGLFTPLSVLVAGLAAFASVLLPLGPTWFPLAALGALLASGWIAIVIGVLAPLRRGTSPYPS